MINPGLSVCMIIYNEEVNLKRCLSSIKNIADEIVIVDTGSTDNSIEVAKSFQALVISHEWGEDFSAARNLALEKATKEWILVMDADEVLQDDQITTYMENNDVDGYFVRFINFYGQYEENSFFIDYACRLFRNHPSIRFQGLIHEEVTTSLKAYGWQIGNSDITLHHYGYLHTNEEKQKKHERNLSIIKKALTENTKDSRLNYALGVEYMQAEKYEDAYRIFTKLLTTLPPSTDFAPDIVLKTAHLLRFFQKSEEALTLVKQGLLHYPDFADLHDAKAEILLELHQYLAAIQSLQQSCSCPVRSTYSSQAGAGSFRTLYHLGQAHEKLLDIESAVHYYQESLNKAPTYKPAWKKYTLWSTSPYVSPQFSNDLKRWKESLKVDQWLLLMRTLLASRKWDRWDLAKQQMPERVHAELSLLTCPLAEALTLSTKGQKQMAVRHLLNQKKAFNLEQILFIWCVYYEENLNHKQWLKSHMNNFSLLADLYKCLMEGYQEKYKEAVTLATWMFLESRMIKGYIRFAKSLDMCCPLPMTHLYLFSSIPIQSLQEITEHLKVDTQKLSVEECLAITLLQIKSGTNINTQETLRYLIKKSPSSPLPRLVTLLNYQSKTDPSIIKEIDKVLVHLTYPNSEILLLD
ncbi:glycosyltransferase family 2 protein [Sediminibacillus massiliensis]|uniref:glycosyltransferase family 2 protein n=1 Tax=Sediminibacillus massiliensis TaxID=1926277 RepID=UPI0009884CC1|nr:glycosyltransferase family 2 protein [Sediminibacillus massiliensis]